MSIIKNTIIPGLFKGTLNKIHQFRDKHKGESCYLFGDGISLKYFDLEKFNDKISIIGGVLPFHKDFGKLNPAYFTLIDPFFFYPFIRTTSGDKKRIYNAIQIEYRKSFNQYNDKPFFISLSNIPVTYKSNLFYIFRNLYDPSLPGDFISNRFNCFEGTLRSQILLAIYMGFKDVYLVGHDYTHYPSLSLHFYERGPGIEGELKEWNKDFFSAAKKYLNLTAITMDRKSETINYIDYKTFTGADLVYKENVEIVSESHLKVLSTWPGYKIY